MRYSAGWCFGYVNNKRLKARFFYVSIPALAGFAIMYLYPFIRTLWYSMIDNTFQRNFVFFDNYINVFNNQFFKLAVKNTFIFSLIGVFCVITLSLLLSFGLRLLGQRFELIKYLLISPMVLPTAGVIFAWQLAFQNETYREMIRHVASTEFWTILPIYLLYIWKNTGLNIIILSAAIAGVPNEVYEASSLDGAGVFQKHRHITLPLITPAIMFVVVLSFVNALRNFRESYLFFGTNYPPDVAYTLQYYMNNHFGRLNYPTLTTASVIFTVIIATIILVMYRLENKYNERIY